MAERDHKYDIQIGEEEWIENIDIAGRYAQAVNIDEQLTGLWPLLDRLETHCVAGCCGFDAYDFTRAGIATALAELEPAQLRQLAAASVTARHGVAGVASEVMMSERMNNLAHKRVFLRLLEHVDGCLSGR